MPSICRARREPARPIAAVESRQPHPRLAQVVRPPEIVIVDPDCEPYESLMELARGGAIGLHACVDGQAALRLARRFRADLWLVNTDLPDIDGFDLVTAILPRIRQAALDPSVAGVPTSLSAAGAGRHDGVFLVASRYRLDDEQRALASGASGYLVRPLDADLLRAVLHPVPTI
jgi:PleD family two-component response regulator